MELSKQLGAAEAQIAARADGSRLLKEEVTEDDISEIISKWTGESWSVRDGH
jgi:ATP-dependent Clp protease ATP-binding subunit ClpB